MPANRNALIRYQTIDKCLRNRYRLWTLENLIDACSDALYEFEGIDKGVSKRTVQMDIQTMRSDKLGYNAPIIVKDKKYYTYEDPEFSITNLPLNENDLSKLNEAVDILKQFKQFNHFREMIGVINKLENKIDSETGNQSPIIHIDKNENLKGIDLLDSLYKSIQQNEILEIEYKSFKAKRGNSFHFYPTLLKEFNNRWFLVGNTAKDKYITHLALDRIISFKKSEKRFEQLTSFNADSYYKDVIGVTVNEGLMPRTVVLKFNTTHTPYVKTKPLHHSQQLISEEEFGGTFQYKLIPNFELERIILGFGNGVEVISPPSLRKKIRKNIKESIQLYSE